MCMTIPRHQLFWMMRGHVGWWSDGTGRSRAGQPLSGGTGWSRAGQLLSGGTGRSRAEQPLSGRTGQSQAGQPLSGGTRRSRAGQLLGGGSLCPERTGRERLPRPPPVASSDLAEALLPGDTTTTHQTYSQNVICICNKS